ncbi:CCDC38 isoform 2 [Pan troglodytes]|uniref:CCDC38 isoform 2 n=1 Tax=Pan troglodytes TaxID=9598 RepID=A0A2J8N0P5_PANTR|nr:CCDC38 isoform 2 [Pan troglodytes]
MSSNLLPTLNSGAVRAMSVLWETDRGAVTSTQEMWRQGCLHSTVKAN